MPKIRSWPILIKNISLIKDSLQDEKSCIRGVLNSGCYGVGLLHRAPLTESMEAILRDEDQRLVEPPGEQAFAFFKTVQSVSEKIQLRRSRDKTIRARPTRGLQLRSFTFTLNALLPR